jgi:plasmid stability protein
MRTRTTQEERIAFLAVLHLESRMDPGEVNRAGGLILRHAATHGRYAEAECCRELEPWEAKKAAQTEKRLEALAEELGVTLSLEGDPRGFTVKLKTPKSGKYNTWGGAETGWGVPTS